MIRESRRFGSSYDLGGRGAFINSIFLGHFQNMARGHFIIRNLERKYGEKTVNNLYLI
ncbi:MAG: hypothetical protein BWX55_00075 [Deltaproteobacteria bacterium ADurb.Bin022]|jgi:hypothetical protein|nr:MAG: hypothetical protein BWX55_00075 [Deltaproteobacteria bacterium ADurb.Bin022]